MLGLAVIEREMQPGGLLIYGKRAMALKKVLKKQYILSIEDFNTLFIIDKD